MFCGGRFWRRGVTSKGTVGKEQVGWKQQLFDSNDESIIKIGGISDQFVFHHWQFITARLIGHTRV